MPGCTATIILCLYKQGTPKKEINPQGRDLEHMAVSYSQGPPLMTVEPLGKPVPHLASHLTSEHGVLVKPGGKDTRALG